MTILDHLLRRPSDTMILKLLDMEERRHNRLELYTRWRKERQEWVAEHGPNTYPQDDEDDEELWA